MPLGTARPAGSSGEFFNHVAGVRMRVVGTGDLKMTLFSSDAVESTVLTPFTLEATSRLAPFRIANFTEQRVQLEFKTTELNETFRINRIILYMKPVFAEEIA